MKKLLIGVAVVSLMIVALGSTLDAWGDCAGNVTTKQLNGTRTFKITFDCDTLSDIGGSHQDDSSVYTPWVQVPVGVSFAAFITSPDADSNSFGHLSDTIHVTLQTAPTMSYAVDSVSTRAMRMRQKAMPVNIWSSYSTGFTKITQMRYFDRGQGVADTAWQTPNAAAAAIDTLDILVGALKDFGFGDMSGSTWLPHNLGNLRFQVHQGTQDMITDGKLRLEMYIVYHESVVNDGRSYGWRPPLKVDELTLLELTSAFEEITGQLTPYSNQFALPATRRYVREGQAAWAMLPKSRAIGIKGID